METTIRCRFGVRAIAGAGVLAVMGMLPIWVSITPAVAGTAWLVTQTAAAVAGGEEIPTPSERYLPGLRQGDQEKPALPPPSGSRAAAENLIADGGKAQAQSYLDKGRSALARRDLIAAEAWYKKAAAMNVDFGRDEYSPNHLAEGLRRAGVDPKRLQLPRGQRAATGLAENGPPRTRSRFGTSVQQPPAADARPQPPSSQVRFSPPPPLRGDQRGIDLLREARLALAAGDDQSALQLASQAAQVQRDWTRMPDSPQRLQHAVAGYRKLMPAIRRKETSPAFVRDYAAMLMEQADGLMVHQQLNGAERLARTAYQLKAEFPPNQRTPAQQLARIASMRRQLVEAEADKGRQPPSGGGQVAQQPQPLRLPPTAAPSAEEKSRHSKAVALLAQARASMAHGDLNRAQELAIAAKNMNVPHAEFGPEDERPWMVLIDIQRLRRRHESYAVQTASANQPRTGEGYGVQQGVYRPDRDATRVVAAQGEQPTPAPIPTPLRGGQPVSRGVRLFQQGEQALQDRKLEQALDLFKQAWKFESEMDPFTRHRLRTYLQELQLKSGEGGGETEIDQFDTQQQLLVQQIYSDVSRGLRTAERTREKDPKGSLQRLKELRAFVAQSELPDAAKKQQASRLDRAIVSLEGYIQANLPQIELDERNQQVRDQIDRDRSIKIQVDEKMAQLVQQFNQLMEEHQFAEAEAIARQARELDSQNPLVQTLMWKSKFVRRLQSQLAIREMSEEGFVSQMQSVDESSIGFDDRDPYRFPDVHYWRELTENRRRRSGQSRDRMSEAEVQIYHALKKKVDVNFTQRPLSEVIYTLAAAAGVNVHLDRHGLAAEGITSDTPVTINLSQPITLRSALKHILSELRLSYVIHDEVLKITSQQMRESDVHRRVYNVADLVIPIPNFTPSYNVGLAGALRQAHHDLGVGYIGGQVNNVPLQVASAEGPQNTHPLALAQRPGFGGGGRNAQPVGFGPGGVSGGSQPDFDSLVDLITTTIAPTTWDEVGGPGSVVGFEANLSLVISQTQEVHDEIVDLLEQLRRLQDLQVTIEVRFITLNDNFFERIGVDFDFSIDDNVTALPPDDGGPSVTIGLDPTGQPTADFDIDFSQGSFGAAVPQFGGFDPATAANVGFAILSDIEAFFLIQAAQGDTRTNVMQAPKVTLFNGQQAFVSDTSQTPFVTSVIPVVGDFAAAHQPVIVVLTEGTSLSVQAVVSNDRRFVRLTVVPFFSKIGEVQEFTFNGKRSVRASESITNPDAGGGGGEEEEAEEIIEGTTVQLPTFSFVTVTTTVSVPDGGTVLLGGVKRLSEGRNERGVPVLNKLPYINRLFKNVGIGRETQSLMMMVTPRIIIQEEEEEKLGIGGFGTGNP